MKTIKLIALGIILFLGNNVVKAQLIVTATIAMQPIWNIVPVQGPRYEYYPEHEMYFDRQTYMYVYFDGSSWSRSAYIPAPFININFGAARRISITDYRGREPYVFIGEHRRMYGNDEHGGHDKDMGRGGEQGHDNGNHGNDNGNHGNENVNRGNENHMQGGNEHKGGGEGNHGHEGGGGKRK